MYIIGSAEALPILCVRCVRWEIEIQERDGSDATIVALKLAMSLHFSLPKILTWRWVYTFPCQKFALFVSPFTLLIPHPGHHFVALKFAMSSHFPLPKISPSLFRFRSQVARLFFPLKKWIKLIPKTIGNRKKDIVLSSWGCARRIDTTWENLQIEKHRRISPVSGTSAFLICAFDLQIFSGGVYPPSATSRTISFSISNSFWY